MAGKSPISKDDFDEPSTTGGLKRNKREDVNQNFTTASDNKVEKESGMAAASDVEADRFPYFTAEQLHALRDRHNYCSNFPNEMKKKAKEILKKKYKSKEQQVFELFQTLKIKASFSKVLSTTGECLVSVEGDCDYDFYLVALKSEIHAVILDYFRNMLS